LGWVILLHIPRALADLHNIGETSGVFEALALSGAAFILADRGWGAPARARDHQIGGSSSRPDAMSP